MNKGNKMNNLDKRLAVIDRELLKGGLRGRINAMCASCIYDPQPGNGNWRQQTEACTSTACPLFEVRPVSKSGKTGDLTP